MPNVEAYNMQNNTLIMPTRNVVSWSVMIIAYTMHGCAREGLQFFEKMQGSSMNPYHVTFIDVMSACFHSSLVDDGWRYFNLMTQCYHITPEWRIVVAWLTFFKLYNKCCYPKLRKVSW